MKAEKGQGGIYSLKKPICVIEDSRVRDQQNIEDRANYGKACVCEKKAKQFPELPLDNQPGENRLQDNPEDGQNRFVD